MTVIQPPAGPPGSISCAVAEVAAGSSTGSTEPERRPATSAAKRPGPRRRRSRPAFLRSSSASITAGVAVTPGGRSSAPTSTGPSKPSRRLTFRGTSVVPPRGMFGFSVPRTTRNDGTRPAQDQVIAEVVAPQAADVLDPDEVIAVGRSVERHPRVLGERRPAVVVA